MTVTDPCSGLEVNVKVTLAVACPFCPRDLDPPGLVAYIGAGVLHSEPVCPTFASLDGPEFIALCASLTARGGAA